MISNDDNVIIRISNDDNDYDSYSAKKKTKNQISTNDKRISDDYNYN